MRDVAREHKLPYVALYETFQDRHEAGHKLLEDGLHPNNDGHQQIFELVQPALDEYLAVD